MQDLNFIGIGGACNIEQGGNCAYIVDKNNLLLIDCAEGVTNALVSKKILTPNVQKILIVLTHTHADHICGIGTLIWYCNLVLKLKPTIFCNSRNFQNTVTNLLDIFGVNRKLYQFTKDNEAKFLEVKIKALPVSHYKGLECFAILFEDKIDKIVYSGDTNDIDFIKKQAQNPQITKIYCEVSKNYYPVHIFYDDLKTIKEKYKFVLMHFSTFEDYLYIKKDGLFKVATITK